MKRISTLVIGAGQAGLAMSHCLTERSEPHVVLERGQIGNSWARERWDSLRMQSPNWQTRLPGHAYAGSDPDGYMTMPEVRAYLESYAAKSAAPVETGVTVTSVTRDDESHVVKTTKGTWRATNVVLASGACNQASIPGFAQDIPDSITQVSPLSYRRPSDLPEGGVLVVGASATGVQLAAEIQASGRPVILATGNHIRMPRRYRGHDITWLLEHSGLFSKTLENVDDINRVRSLPSLQLIGDRSCLFLDLNALQDMGVEIVGRLTGCRDGTLLFSGSLANTAVLSDLKMNRALSAIDDWALQSGLEFPEPPRRFAPTLVPAKPRLALPLASGAISTIVWASGFRPDMSWLQMPVFDGKGRIRHAGGIVAPGLYVLGLPFLRTRKSTFLDGVGDDARVLAQHIADARLRQAA
ncbi:NAD(P)-binding domain-containing protein [Frigidibacter sp. ROC022]|uniref:NAD(P)-binding domain-containing protein n=1 Tax=Frigidibacter sp. ROC022 TaxID=2971796 RepID=UPI00215A6CD1|nr:NAD(P)-binding domain-containing protein [Frigidibacter sp. ROC022]MCR8723486.1 NAD(P)-binding domain-containing protein [Frigidibacter sp. ROC022]